jgi:VCBS repeat-containing protein
MPTPGIRTLAALAVFIAGGAAAAVPATSQTVSQALLRVHTTVQDYTSGTKWFDQDLFVSTSGFSQAVGTFGNTLDPLGLWLYTADTATASHQALSALRTALDAGHIGIQQSCVLDPSFPDQGTVELTWYGRNRRRNLLTVAIDTVPPEQVTCPPDLCQILLAIQTYTFTVHKLRGFNLRCAG